jgi:hypothetical protein
MVYDLGLMIDGLMVNGKWLMIDGKCLMVNG